MIEHPTVYRLRGVRFPLVFTLDGNQWVLRMLFNRERRTWTCTLDGPTWWHVGTFRGRGESPDDISLVISDQSFLARIFAHLATCGIAQREPAMNAVAPVPPIEAMPPTDVATAA